jgi:sugar phosphate isomerase/epimerase
MDVVALLERGSSLGVDVIQIADNLPLNMVPESTLVEVVDRAKALGLELEVGTVGLSPEVMDRYLDLALMLGSKIVRVVVDTPEDRPSVEDIIARLDVILPAYAVAGVRLLIENHDRLRAATLREILIRVGRPELGICLDTVNSLGGLEAVGTVAETLAPWVMNVHVKDFVIERTNHKMGFLVEGRPAGEGMVDIPSLIALARALPHEVNVVLEQWPPFVVDLNATIEQEARWAEESVTNLRRWIPS